VSPQRRKKAKKCNLFEDDGDDDDEPSPGSTGAGSDRVVNEVKGWEALSKDRCQPFKSPSTGLLDEFALLFALRREFPLHFFVFKQVCIPYRHYCSVTCALTLVFCYMCCNACVLMHVS
jgi:hypothetical protein